MSSHWTHAICAKCWAERKPDKPLQPKNAGQGMLEVCCFCGVTTQDGIYLRADPAEPKFCNHRDEAERKMHCPTCMTMRFRSMTIELAHCVGIAEGVHLVGDVAQERDPMKARREVEQFFCREHAALIFDAAREIADGVRRERRERMKDEPS
jgi:hypothetical protein